MDDIEIPGARGVVVHDDLEQLSRSVARTVEMIALRAIAARGVFCIALSGGRTPRRCYELLRDTRIEWERVQLYFVDERCLPRGDVQRNDRMVHEALLDHVAIPPGNVHAIPAERGATRAAAEYAEFMKVAPPLDLVLLGMGEDGHVASLFPGNPAAEQKELVVPVFNAPKPPAERVSLGMGMLNSARNGIFLVAGETKREALRKMVSGTVLPAVQVRGAEWHVDRAAVAEH